MDSRKTLFLLVLVALVGGFVVWDHYQGTPTEERETKAKRLVDLDAKAVTRLELIRSNQTILVEKSGEHWEIKQPLVSRAEHSAVSSLLDELEFAQRTRTLTEQDVKQATLTELGLADPRLTLKLQAKQGPVTLKIGAETPGKDALYVQVEGRREVYVAAKTVFDRSNQSLDQLRSRTAVDFTSASATRLEIKASDRIIELAKTAPSTNAEPRWALVRPLATRADQSKVNALLNDLAGLRILDFVSDKPEDVHTYHLEEPDREVTVYTGESGRTLLLGKPLTNDATKLYAKLKAGQSIFTLSADAATKFASQINDLRDTRVLSFDPLEVKSVELTRGSDSLALTQETGAWKITAPHSIAADDDAVRRLLDNLAGLRAKEFAADVATDLEKFGLATPMASVTLRGATTNTILLGTIDHPTGVQFVKRADEPFIYAVDTATTVQLPTHYGTLRSREVFALPVDQIKTLSVGDTTVARDDQGKWKLVAPAQGVLDADAADAIAGLFANLRADAFGRAKTDADNALGTTIRATVGDATHWLALAKDGQAAASSVELTFTLLAGVPETLSKPLVTSAVPPAP